MIFVIIGVAILVVSFIVALQSLIKEQQKAQHLHSEDEEPALTSDDTAEEKKKSVLSHEAQELLKKSPVQPNDISSQYRQPQVQSQPDIDSAQDLVASPDQKDEDKEPFPWEKDFDNDSIKKIENEGEKIERLKSQLEQIKAAKNASSYHNPDTVSDKKSQMGSPDFQDELRGEISMRDLKKKSF